jgi:hypothetical protein
MWARVFGAPAFPVCTYLHPVLVLCFVLRLCSLATQQVTLHASASLELRRLTRQLRRKGDPSDHVMISKALAAFTSIPAGV